LLGTIAMFPALGAEQCVDEPATAGLDRHFMVLAGRTGVFYDDSGPAFVMLLRAGAEESEVGAVGIYADPRGQPLFGAVPAARYNEYLRESATPDDVMLRVEITGAQYERALGVLRAWDRRAREDALLYPEISLNNILLVKQATEELNACTEALALHALDWGLDDDISENHEPLAIPLEYFRKLRRLNEPLHVRDAAMPPSLLEPDAAPLPPRPVSFEQPVVHAPAQPHVHAPAAPALPSDAGHDHHAPASPPQGNAPAQ
jgi:hypothetical protein